MTAPTLTQEQVEEGKRLLAAVDQAYRDAPDDAPAVVRGALVSAAVDQFKWWALVNRRAIFATLDAQRERIKDAEAERDAASRRADGLMAAMRAACKAAGVEDAQFRDLRAKAGTEEQAAGGDPTLLLGHMDPRTTRIYLRGRRIVTVKPRRRA